MTFVFLLSLNSAICQNENCINEGKIEFVKTTNLHFVMEGDYFTEEITDKYPKFIKSKFTLYFNSKESLFKPDIENTSQILPIELNDLDMVYLNLNDTAFRVTKRFYQTRLQILGKAIEIKWRITNEKKYIAGFECTRANGIYRDSIYTVAFFCSEITPPLGPLTFHGLPGMILGISLPSLHTSWYATRVYNTTIEKNTFNNKNDIPEMSILEYNKKVIESLQTWHGNVYWYLNSMKM